MRTHPGLEGAATQSKALIVTGPAQLREQLRHLSTPMLIASCARLRPGPDHGDAEQATKTALRRLSRRHQHLSEEITEANHELDQLVSQVAPTLLALPGVGREVAGQMLTSAGDNLDRITPEAAFAHLRGAAPIPPAAAAPTGTGSIEAATAARTTPSTSSFSAGSATTRGPAPTWNDAPAKASPNPRSSDA